MNDEKYDKWNKTHSKDIWPRASERRLLLLNIFIFSWSLLLVCKAFSFLVYHIHSVVHYYMTITDIYIQDMTSCLSGNDDQVTWWWHPAVLCVRSSIAWPTTWMSIQSLAVFPSFDTSPESESDYNHEQPTFFLYVCVWKSQQVT